MSYFSNTNKKYTTNFGALGGYSPLSGFEYEDEHSKNPYQQILSSLPQEETLKTYAPLSGSYFQNYFDKQITSANNIPDIPIDSTFYNRKDIYDLKQRLKASGEEIPEGTKDKPGFITRALNILSTPGQAVTTALYNAFDGKDNTKVLKGLLDGTVGSLTSNEDKIKTGSDLMDLMLGERTGKEGFDEKAGRFVGGLALDILLDPTTYLSGGTTALLKGASKKGGKEVTEEAVKNAIKGVNGIVEGAQGVNKVLDLDTQAKRIAKQINEKNVKAYSGLTLGIPFTKIEKELISAEKIAEISKALGIDKAVSNTVGKIGEGAKSVWNYNKAENGIRESLEALPDAVMNKMFKNHELNKIIKSDPLRASKTIASNEVQKHIDYLKNVKLKDAYKGAENLAKQMQDLGVPEEVITEAMEKVKKLNEAELNDEAVIDIFNTFIKSAKKQTDKATLGVTKAENEMLKVAQELLDNKKIEFAKVRELNEFINKNGIDLSNAENLDEATKIVDNYKKETLKLTPEDVGMGMTYEQAIDNAKHKQNMIDPNREIADWETYALESKTIVNEFLERTGLSPKEFDEFLAMDEEGKKKWYNAMLNRKMQEQGIEIITKPDGKKVVTGANKVKFQKLQSDMVQLKNMFNNDIIGKNGKLTIDKKRFIKDNNIIAEPYVASKSVDEAMLKIEEEVAKDKNKILRNAKSFNKDADFTNLSEDELKNIAQEIADKWFVGSKKADPKEMEALKTKFIDEFIANNKGQNVHKGTKEILYDMSKDAINKRAEEFYAYKDKILTEMGMRGVKPVEDLYDKFVEQNLLNMVSSNERFALSPFKSFSYKSFRNKFTSLVTGDIIGSNKKINNSVFDLLDRLGEKDLFMQGKSTFNNASMKQIYGARAWHNTNAKARLRSIAGTYLDNILIGSGIEANEKVLGELTSKIEDKMIKEFKDVIYNKKMIDGKMVTEDVIFNDLPRNVKDYLLTRSRKIVEETLDEDDFFKGRLKHNRNAETLEYRYDNVLKNERRTAEYFNKDEATRQYLTNEEARALNPNMSKKNTIGEYEYHDRDVRPLNVQDETKYVTDPNKWTKEEVNAVNTINDKYNGSYKSEYKDAKYKYFEEQIQGGKALREQMAKDPTMKVDVFKEDFVQTSKMVDFEADVKAELPKGVTYQRNIDLNPEQANEVIKNKVQTGDVRNMKVKELKEMLGEYGIKGISKATKQQLLDICDVVVGKSARVGIDLTKKTPDEIKKLFKQLGIEDTKLNEALEKLVGAKDFERRAKLSKDALDTSLARFTSGDNDVAMLQATVQNLFGDRGVELWNNYSQTKLKNKQNLAVGENLMKSPIELVRDNQEVIDMLGGGEKAERFLVDYTEYMRNMYISEKDFGLDYSAITSQGYVPRRMGDEAREQMLKNNDLNTFMESYFRDRKNLIYKEQSFMKHRTGSTSTISQLNEMIYKDTLEKFGEEGAIKNFFETDLSRLIIQRAYEHGMAFYDFKLKDMYLNKLGVPLTWAKGKDGILYNVVENANGLKWVKKGQDKTVNELIGLLNKQDYKSIRKEIESFMPSASYLPDGKLEKVKKNALDSLDRLENYISSGANNPKKFNELKNEVLINLPQRGFARELQDLVKKGEIKLVYPQGESAEITLNALKDSAVNEVLQESMWNKKAKAYQGTIDYTELTWEDFEKLQAKTKEVPVFAVDTRVYNAYQEAMTKQFVKDTDPLLKIYDKVSGIWKKMATTSVGFHTRNAFGNVMQMYLDVGAKSLDPKYMKMAHEVGKESAEVLLKDPNGVEYTGKMLNDLFIQTDPDQMTQLSSEFDNFADFNKVRKGKIDINTLLNGGEKVKKNPINALFDTSQKIGDSIEQLAKRQQFCILIEQGLDPIEARQHINKFLFDYSDLTPFEREFMKRVIPFYTFAKKNMGLQIDMLFNNPTPLKNAKRIFDNQQKSMVSTENEKLLNDNDRDKIILGGDRKRTISTNLPWIQDFDVLGALSPAIKTPLEMATNKNFTYGNDIEQYGGQVKEASPIEGLLGGLLGQTEVGEDGNTYINAKAKHLITNLLPSVRTLDRSIDNVSGDDKIGGLMSFFGLGGQEFSETKRTSYEVREYKEMLENLEKKLQSKGVDTREKLKQAKQLESLMQRLNIQ